MSEDTDTVSVTATTDGPVFVAKWQPIETAPTNGELVLLYLDPPVNWTDVWGAYLPDDLRIVVGWATHGLFGRRWECGFCDEGTADTDGYCSPTEIAVFPTHWMPLPKPPAGNAP